MANTASIQALTAIAPNRRVAAMKVRERGVLDRLADDFEKRLASMQEPGFAKKVDAVFAGQGKLRSRPKAGAAF